MANYHEYRWYGLGLRIGLLNLLRNGNALGARKTLGKIFQPVNSYTRFPEYHFFEYFLTDHLRTATQTTAMVLDVGSPKLFGLGLARDYPFEARLTDITRMNLDEYATMWRAIAEGAAGKAHFEQQDARELTYNDGQFDVVYSMSVIEHIECIEEGTSAIREMWRVLKPGGLLVLSVPFGRHYTAQHTTGFAYTDNDVIDDQRYFFQHIYDQQALQTRILEPLSAAEDLQLITIYRRNSFMTPLYHKLRQALGENINGLLGFLNPLISKVLNCHVNRIDTNFHDDYTSIQSLKDICADAVIVCRKPMQAIDEFL